MIGSAQVRASHKLQRRLETCKYDTFNVSIQKCFTGGWGLGWMFPSSWLLIHTDLQQWKGNFVQKEVIMHIRDVYYDHIDTNQR